MENSYNSTIKVNEAHTIAKGLSSIKVLSINSKQLDFLALNGIITIEKDGREIVNVSVKPYLKLYHSNIINFSGAEFDIRLFNECKMLIKVSDKNINDDCNLHCMIL